MDSEIKKQWVEALRSGKYKQTREALRQEYINDPRIKQSFGYCCLGVLCEIHPDVRWVDSRQPALAAYGDRAYGDRMSDINLPLEFRLEVGITEAEEAALINMNDEQEMTFEQIADYIEKNL